MGKSYTPPKVEKLVTEDVKFTDEKLSLEPTDTVDAVEPVTENKFNPNCQLFVNALNNFIEVLNGKKGYADLIDRDKDQAAFITTLENMLRMKYKDMYDCSQYLVAKMKENDCDAFSDHRIYAPLYRLEGSLSPVIITRYKAVMEYFKGLGQNRFDPKRFNTMYDTVRMINMFSGQAKINLNEYVNRF